jgi:hypothetical protein
MSMTTTYNIENELTILDPKKVKFNKDEFNRLKMKIEDDIEYSEVIPIMGFPLTNSEGYVSIFEIKDGKKEKEIGIIEEIKKLDSKSKKLLKEELNKSYFMPKIIKINSMKENHGVMKFDVETNKGRRIFETRYKEDIRKLPKGGVFIKDADGNRYEVEDYNKLDKKSASLIDTEV